MPVAEVSRKAEISQATYFNWKTKYAGLLPDEMCRLKQLEDENNRLKTIVADLTLDCEMLLDAIRRKLVRLFSPLTGGGLTLTLPGSASLSTGCWQIGGYRSDGSARR